MPWGVFGATIAAKVALNFFIPGSGLAIELVKAAGCVCVGDYLGAFIIVASEVATGGLASSTKDLMKLCATGAVVQTAKETAKLAGKQATKKVGQDLGKQLAKGLITGRKAAAIQTAKETAKAYSKEATKQVGQQVGKEIAKGVVTEAVEEAWREGTKFTLNELGKTAMLGAISSGGKEVVKTTLEDVTETLVKSGVEKIISETVKQEAKKAAFELTIDAATTAAKEEFMKHSYKCFVKDAFFKTLTGIKNMI